MQNEMLHIYVDESGTTDLASDQTDADFYVIVALLIPETDLEKYRESAQNIVTKHVVAGELKSSSIGKNVNRRTKILIDIRDYDFKYYCLVVNKSSIYRDSGLRYKTVFYKFLHRMFYSRIKRSFMGINITIDQYGSSDFMKSFKTYLFDFNNLFNTVEFYPSADIPLLQISDFISGTVRRIYQNLDPVELLKIINYPSVPIEEWPPNFSKEIDLSGLSNEDKYDEFIRKTSIDGAKTFIQDNLGNENSELNEQALTLRYLLFRYFENTEEYVFRIEIAKYLTLVTDSTFSEHNVSSKLIAKIRDANVILVSTDKGIKIPNSHKDILSWIGRVDSQVVPYLMRVEHARNEFLIASKNEFDIINEEIFPSLSRYLSNKGRIA